VEEYQSKGLFIPTMTFDDLQLDADRIGQGGSPTKVYKIDSVVLTAGDHIRVEPDSESISELIDQLMQDRIFG
jgi:electron transfer flavoprotein beta subunit